MEKYVKILTPDNFEISGVLNWEKKSSKLIVFVHGLTGSMTEAHFYAAKEYFQKKGFEVFRFNLYAGGKKARQLHECSIKDHSVDVETVLQYFSGEYQEISIAGHSLGGPSIVWAKDFPVQLKKMIFWDPAFDTSSTLQRCFEKNGIWFFYPKNGKNIEISKKMYDEFVENKHFESIKNMTFPVSHMHIIFARDCDKVDFKDITDSFGISSCVIEGANHGFTQEGKYEELFEKTLKFIET